MANRPARKSNKSDAMTDSTPAPPKQPPARRNNKKFSKKAAPPEPEAPPPSAPEPPPAAPQPATLATGPKKNNKKRKAPEPPADDESVVSASVVSESVVSESVVSMSQKKTKPKRAAKKASMRTPSNYVLFSLDKRKEIMANNQDLSLGEISKLCGQAWKALSADDRAPYNERAQALKDARKEELLANAPPAKKKRTPSSYLLFAVEHRKKVMAENPGFKIGECSKVCGAAWKALDAETKQTYIDKAAELKANGQ